MSFLAPLFLLGLAGLAIPVIIHLIQRDHRRVVPFPSLMFVRRIPYQSVRRRRIRHWALLMLRLAALALIVFAFARPFLARDDVRAAGASGPRELVVLLDRSYSMGYGDRWARARAAAREALEGLGPSDRGSIVLFASNVEVAVRSTGDRARLLSALGVVEPADGSTRYAPALRVAGSILSESQLPTREAVLISDFQRSGWKGGEPVRLPEGAGLTIRSIAEDAATPDLAVTPVSLARSTFSNQQRVTVTGGVLNRGAAAVTGAEVTLEIDGRAVQSERVDLEPHGAATVTFAPVTMTARQVRGTVRIPADPLVADNAFHFVASPAQPLGVLLVERPGAPSGTSLYLRRALAVGDTPRFEVTVASADRVTDEQARTASVIVVNDVPVPDALARRLGRAVEQGAGLLVIAGPRATWPAAVDVLPAVAAANVDRSDGEAARVGSLEYGHPVFELFKSPRSGDFSTARFYGYRAGRLAESATVLARFDGSVPGLIERRVGQGRVLMWMSTLDLFWTDLPLKPVFLPFLHRAMRHLASYSEPPAWMTVGEVLDPSQPTLAPTGSRIALTPSGERLTLDEEGNEVIELTERGFYEIRTQENEATPMVVASNVDLAESDLEPIDTQEIVAAALAVPSGRAGAAAADGVYPPAVQERMQRLWWYLLCAGLILLGVETVLSNRTRRGQS